MGASRKTFPWVIKAFFNFFNIFPQTHSISLFSTPVYLNSKVSPLHLTSGVARSSDSGYEQREPFPLRWSSVEGLRHVLWPFWHAVGNTSCRIPEWEIEADPDSVMNETFRAVLYLFPRYDFHWNKYKRYYGPGRRPLAYLLYYNAYGKSRLPPVHRYSCLRSTAHRAAACSRPLR